MLKHIRRITSVLLAAVLFFGLFPVEIRASETGVLYGETTVYSTFRPGTLLEDGYFYSDEWFLRDPAERNDALALVSMQLAASCVTEDGEDVGIALLKQLGFEESGFVNRMAEDPDGCNFTWARKTLSEEETLIAVVIQSYSFERTTKAAGWTQNFVVNGENEGPEHYGFSLAAESILPELRALDSTGKARFWIMGQSRGGAVANLLAKKLMEEEPGIRERLFALTFEAPFTVDESAAGGEYAGIHNYVCSDDPVTRIPPWDMTRYGQQFVMNSRETDQRLMEELHALGSEMEGLCEEYFEKSEKTASIEDALLEALKTQVPDRSAYSEVHEDVVMTEDGETKVLCYDYQTAVSRFAGMLLGSPGEGLSLDAVLSDIVTLTPMLYGWLYGYLLQDNSTLWASAEGLYSYLMKNAEGTTEFTAVDLYAILKLLAPVLIDKNYELPEEPPKDATGLIIAATPAFELLGHMEQITFSHHFDSLMARLHALSPGAVVTRIKEGSLKAKDLKKKKCVAAEIITAADKDNILIDTAGTKKKLRKYIKISKDHKTIRLKKGAKKGAYTFVVSVSGGSFTTYTDLNETFIIIVE